MTDKGYHSGAVVKRVKGYEVRSYLPEKKPQGRRNWAGKQPEQQAVYANLAKGKRRVRQESTAAARRVRGAQLRALLRNRWYATLSPTGTRQHLEAAVGSCRRVQPEPDPAQVVGRGHAARAEKPPWQARFVRLLTLPGPDKPESALQKPNLHVCCQVLREFAYPTTAPALQKIRHLRHGLLAFLRDCSEYLVWDFESDGAVLDSSTHLLAGRGYGKLTNPV